ARGDNRDRDCFSDCACEFQVITSLLAILIHACEKNFACPVRLHFPSPDNSIDAHRLSAAVRVNFPFQFRVPGLEFGARKEQIRISWIVGPRERRFEIRIMSDNPLGVYSNNDALTTEAK